MLTCDWCAPSVPAEPRWGPSLWSSTPPHGPASSPAQCVPGSSRGLPAHTLQHHSGARNAQPAGSECTHVRRLTYTHTWFSVQSWVYSWTHSSISINIYCCFSAFTLGCVYCVCSFLTTVGNKWTTIETLWLREGMSKWVEVSPLQAVGVCWCPGWLSKQKTVSRPPAWQSAARTLSDTS